MTPVKLGDHVSVEGVIHRLIQGDKVPKVYIEVARIAQGRTVALHAALYREGDVWRQYSDLPTHLYQRGDWNAAESNETNSHYAVFVPVQYLEPEVNEFGKVMP